MTQGTAMDERDEVIAALRAELAESEQTHNMTATALWDMTAERDAARKELSAAKAENDLANKAAEMHRQNFEKSKALLNETLEVEADLRSDLTALRALLRRWVAQDDHTRYFDSHDATLVTDTRAAIGDEK